MVFDLDDEYSAIDEAIRHLELALDDLDDSDEDDAVAALNEVHWNLQHKLKELGVELDKRDDEELALMNREYERGCYT